MQYHEAVSHGLTASGEWPTQRTESRQFTTEEVAAVALGPMAGCRVRWFRWIARAVWI